MYTIDALELVLELQYKIANNNSEIGLEIKQRLQQYIDKLIMINADSICVSNILYLARIESELLQIKRFMEEGL